MLRGPNGSGRFHADGRRRPAAGRMGRAAGAARALGVRDRHVFRLGRHFGGDARQSARCLRPAVRRATRRAACSAPISARAAACRWSTSPAVRRTRAGSSRPWKRWRWKGWPQPISTNSAVRCCMPTNWCTTAARATSTTNSRPAPSKHSDLGCLMENLGCKGTQAHADCNQRLWNGDGSCLRGGFACIACTEPGFEEPGHAFQRTPKVAGIPIGLPTDMPKAWFVALAALSKSATPKRVRENAVADHPVVRPPVRKAGEMSAHPARPLQPRRGRSRSPARHRRTAASAQRASTRRCSAASSRLLAGRAPQDALAIVPRICGICSVAQSAAAAAALAAAAGVRPPRNGELARIPGAGDREPGRPPERTSTCSSCRISRAPAYAGRPWHGDIATPLHRVARQRGRRPAAGAGPPAQRDGLPRRTLAAHAGAAARRQHPGGDGRPSGYACVRCCASSALSSKASCSATRWRTSPRSPAWPQLQAWAAGRRGDFPAFLDTAGGPRPRTHRPGGRQLHLVRCLRRPRSPAGIRRPGWQRSTPLDPAKITEDVAPCLAGRRRAAAASARRDARAGRQGRRLHLVQGAALCRRGGRNRCAGAPDRCRATRCRATLSPRHGASVTARVVARMLELATVLPAMEGWVRALVPGEPFCVPAPLPDEAEAAGPGRSRPRQPRPLAAHRARTHRALPDRRPDHLELLAARRRGRPGPLEQALVGLPAGDGAPPLVQHVVRSFDPCMVCTVH